jgi:hypothetical protein
VAFSLQVNSTDWLRAAAGWWIEAESHGQWIESSRPLISLLYTGAATFTFKYLLNYPHEAKWTTFQTQCFSENLVPMVTEPETSWSVTRNSDHYITEVVDEVVMIILKFFLQNCVMELWSVVRSARNEEYRLLACYAVWLLWEPTFRRNLAPPSSGWQEYEVHFVFLHSLRRLLVTANVVPSSPVLVTLMMEALNSSESSVLTRATRRNIPEDGSLHSHRKENLKSYVALPGWTL